MGWSKHDTADGQILWKGYLHDGMRTRVGADAAGTMAARLAAARGDVELASALDGSAGHYAFVSVAPDRTIASVDRVASTPIAWSAADGSIRIYSEARRLVSKLYLEPADLDMKQVLSVAMSGWTVGGATLYPSIRTLRAGEALVVDSRGAVALRWSRYDAWRTSESSSPGDELADRLTHLVARLAEGSSGRTICLPLSAGRDSRLLASGLKAVGFKDVRLFAYGRSGNHEARASEAIAKHLGYRWTFVPFSDNDWRVAFANDQHNLLWTTFDSCASVPFEQDWIAINSLVKSGYIPDDAVIVNGQTGDFISGNHLPERLFNAEHVGKATLGDALFSAYFEKHASLWAFLSTPRNLAALRALLQAELDEAGFDPVAPSDLLGAFEFLELQDRQAKYVIGGQRCYDAQNLDWRLPLWDDDLVNFFRQLPPRHKRRQNLYRQVLERLDWGGVWRGANYPSYVTPKWLVPVRTAVKAVHLPLGRSRWHKFERRYFQWWMDPLRVSAAAVSYLRQAVDARGARHAVAWLTERYLAGHGVALDSVGAVGA
jgi:asparagine synthase (glutamine-hydrolysing)